MLVCFFENLRPGDLFVDIDDAGIKADGVSRVFHLQEDGTAIPYVVAVRSGVPVLEIADKGLSVDFAEVAEDMEVPVIKLCTHEENVEP